MGETWFPPWERARGERRSRPEPLPVGVVEGTEANPSLVEAAVDRDEELRSLAGELGRHPRHPDHPAQLGAPACARDTAHGPALLDHHLAALRRHAAVLHLEADQLLAIAAGADVLEGPLADEVVLVELDDPRHVRLERVRLGVGVLADEDVHLLEAQDALRLETERPDAEVLATLEDRVPHVFAVGTGEVELVAELADEADPQHERRHPADAALPGVEVRERLVRNVEIREPAHEVARAWSRDVHGGERAGDVD